MLESRLFGAEGDVGNYPIVRDRYYAFEMEVDGP